MTFETTLLFGAIAAGISIASFFAGAQSRSQADGNWRGTVDTKLNAILQLSNDLKELQKCFNTSSLILAEHSESLRAMHRRVSALERRTRGEEETE